MNTMDELNLPAEFASELEKKFFWWDSVGTQPRSNARIVAQAMSFANFEDIRRLETRLGPQRLAAVMQGAEPGWIDDRSWELWRGRLKVAGYVLPETPPRRSF